MSLTTLLSLNLLGLAEDIGACCCVSREPARKAGMAMAVASSKEITPARLRLFPYASQNFVLYLAALATGLYYGYMFGQVAGREITVADARVRYNPWPPVEAYLEYSLPVAATVGFMTLLVAAAIPTLLSALAGVSAARSSNGGGGGRDGVRQPLRGGESPAGAGAGAGAPAPAGLTKRPGATLA